MQRFYRAIAPRRNPLQFSFHTVCMIYAQGAERPRFVIIGRPW